MGIDFTSLEGILLSLPYCKSGNRALTLARQGIHFNKPMLDYFNKKYQRNVEYRQTAEMLFQQFGFTITDSIDCSSYENATHIHDMNKPIPPTLTGPYDFIYDGGTIEHIFNIAQVLENVIDLLKVGGIFCSVTVNNNFSGHGIYQFSPEFFMTAFSERYGMKIHELYLAQVNSEKESWINVKTFNEDGDGRSTQSFNSSKPVYIITIAEKVTNDRLSLLTSSPQQYSYEKIDWITGSKTNPR